MQMFMERPHRARVAGFFLALAAAAGCAQPQVSSPAPSAPARRVPLAVTADSIFWRTFHAGAYDSIPQSMFVLKAAYLQNPADPQTAAHIAFLHAWKISERTRVAQLSPTITDEATLARRYFAQAQKHAPAYDARFHGFGAVFQMVEANIHRDSALWADGLREARQSIAAWPEFNWFTVGYTLSGQPDTSALFAEAIDMQWKTVDSCARAPIDRVNPTATAVLSALSTETDPLRKRACSNSWIAPHNVQGFFLNMGDMIVKRGDPRLARRVYALAKDADGYAAWPYAAMLEERIRDAETNVAAFRSGRVPMMVAGKASCAACHQGVMR
jgi:hypothetical protein